MYAILQDMCGKPCTAYSSCDGDSPAIEFNTNCQVSSYLSNQKFLPVNAPVYNSVLTNMTTYPRGISQQDLNGYPKGLKYVEDAKLYLEDPIPPYPNVPKACSSCVKKNAPEDVSNGPYYPPYTNLNDPPYKKDA